MEFLSLSRRCSSARNVPSGEERGERDVFAGYIDSRLKQVFVFFRPPEVINFRLKSLLETTFAQSKQICSFDDGDTHTRSIDLVGVESAHSATEVKDSQMKSETPNASHATPHFWGEKCKWQPIKRDKSTSRDFVARGQKGSLRSPRGRLVASLICSVSLQS